MRILHDPGDIPYPGIRTLYIQRLSELDLPKDPAITGEMILVEPGDTPASLEAELGIWLTTGLFSEDNFGDEDFMPSFEWLEYHPEHACWEMLFIMNDDSYGTVLFLPDAADMDPTLLTFCRQYATAADL